MPIEIITGVPGSGKTTRVIDKAESLRASGKEVVLWVCSDAKEIGPESSIRQFKRLSSRNGRQISIDHFLGVQETLQLLQQNWASDVTFVFDEAQYYGLSIIDDWLSLSARGHVIILSTPSDKQIKLLNKEITVMENLQTECALLMDGPATKFFVMPNQNITLSVCDSCADVLLNNARKGIEKMLISQEPFPAEKRVYQPVDLPFLEFTELKPIREDSETRTQIMTEHVRRHIGDFNHRSKSYIDVGCNTGYFCKKMADIGFASTGVDIVPGDIRVGKLLDLYFYRRYINFVCSDALNFIASDDSVYDVVSTFSVFQWIYIQSEKKKVDDALDKLFRQSRHLVFFEMGYTEEKHYKGRLTEDIDRDWCFRKMEDTGLFSNIVLYEEGKDGLKRDFFVGIRKP